MTKQANPCRSKQKEHTVQMESPERERGREQPGYYENHA